MSLQTIDIWWAVLILVIVWGIKCDGMVEENTSKDNFQSYNRKSCHVYFGFDSDNSGNYGANRKRIRETHWPDIKEKGEINF